MKRKIAATLMALVGIAVTPTASLATAVGVEYFGRAQKIDTSAGAKGAGVSTSFNVRQGRLYHELVGRGLWVDGHGVWFKYTGTICEPSVKFTYGDGAMQRKGSVHRKCLPTAFWFHVVKRNVPKGDACAELWAKDWKVLVAKQCHYVYGKKGGDPARAIKRGTKKTVRAITKYPKKVAKKLKTIKRKAPAVKTTPSKPLPPPPPKGGKWVKPI